MKTNIGKKQIKLQYYTNADKIWKLPQTFHSNIKQFSEKFSLPTHYVIREIGFNYVQA